MLILRWRPLASAILALVLGACAGAAERDLSDTDNGQGGSGQGGSGSNPPPPSGEGLSQPGMAGSAGSSATVGSGETSVGAVLAVQPSALSIGPAVNGQTAVGSIAVRNDGTAALAPVSVSIEGADAGAFTITQNGCVTALPPSATCFITLTFAPNQARSYSASLEIGGSAAGSASVALTATALAPSALVLAVADGSSADLGGVELGGSRDLTLSLSNSGGVESGVVSFGDLASGFTLLPPAPGDCVPNATSLLPNQSCTVRVHFEPTERGPAALSLLANASSAGQVALSLSGSGLLPATLVSAPPSIDFGSREVLTAARAETWTVTNNGDVATGALTIDNPTPAEFSTTSTCTASLEPGTSCTISVAFTPQAGGPRFAVLSASSGAASTGLEASGTGQFRLTVQRSGTGTGSVVSLNGALNCGTTCSALLDPGPVALVAATTNGANSFFSGWSEPTCAGPAKDCSFNLTSSVSIRANFAPMTNNLIFVASEEQPVTLGGLAPYDRVCNNLATREGINNAAGTGYVAMMSSSTSSLRTRLGNARGWVRLDGLPFSDTQAQLFDQNLVHYSMTYNEGGEFAEDESPVTGTSRAGASSTQTCADWTSASATLNVSGGRSGGGPFYWITAFQATCSAGELWPIACMGNTRTAAIAPLTRSTGKLMWVSSAYTPGSMTPDQKCREAMPAGVTNAVAFISYNNRAASAVLDPNATYIRTDGQVIGTGADLIAQDVLAGPWLPATGPATLDNFGVWSGAATPDAVGTDTTTCFNWGSAAATSNGYVGDIGVANQRFWWTFASGFCNNTRAVYCVQP